MLVDTVAFGLRSIAASQIVSSFQPGRCTLESPGGTLEKFPLPGPTLEFLISWVWGQVLVAFSFFKLKLKLTLRCFRRVASLAAWLS